MIFEPVKYRGLWALKYKKNGEFFKVIDKGKPLIPAWKKKHIKQVAAAIEYGLVTGMLPSYKSVEDASTSHKFPPNG